MTCYFCPKTATHVALVANGRALGIDFGLDAVLSCDVDADDQRRAGFRVWPLMVRERIHEDTWEMQPEPVAMCAGKCGVAISLDEHGTPIGSSWTLRESDGTDYHYCRSCHGD